MDFLSALPPHLSNLIFEKLPIRDAVRTSILSRHWRYTWTKISRLVFDRCLHLSLFPHRYLCHEDTSRLITVINQILSQHTGTVIDHFHCSLETSPHIDPWMRFLSIRHIDRWICFLSIRSIKELLLHICNDNKVDDNDDYNDDYGYDDGWCDRYLLPYSHFASLFACVELTRLELSFCSLKPPATKLSDTWFPKLRVLRLRRVLFFEDGVAEQLIAGCPFLEELTLRDFHGISRLKICAPSLRDVYIAGELDWVSFENAPRAAQVTVFLFSNSSGWQMPHPSLEVLLSGLLAVERLDLGFSLQFLAAGYIPKQLPIFYGGLKNLKLHLNFGDLKEILVALCLLRSSPNLEKLRITPSSSIVSSKHSMHLWQEQENLDCVLHHLRTVKFKLIYGKKVEMEFMKFILANSPVLEKMAIKTYTTFTRVRTSILEELRHTQKASAEAKIFYLSA